MEFIELVEVHFLNVVRQCISVKKSYFD